MSDAAPPSRSTMRRDLLGAYAASSARVLSWAIVSALVYRKMGAGAFATITLVRATIGILNYASLGLAPAMIARLSTAAGRAVPAVAVVEVTPESATLAYASPQANAKPKPLASPVQTLYLSGLALLLILAMVAGVLLVGYAQLFGDVLREPGGLRGDVSTVVIVMGLGLILRFVSDASGAVLQSGGRIALDNGILAGAEILWVLLTIAWITDDADDLVVVAAAYLLGSAGVLIARYLAAEQIARITLVDLAIDWKAGRAMLGYGLMVTLAQLADYLYAPTDFLLINQLLSPTDVAHYAPVVQIDSGLLLLVGGLAGVLLPRAAVAHAAGDVGSLRRYYVRATLASFVLLASAAAAVWALAPWIFTLWLGEPMPVTRSLLPLILISTVVGGSGMVGRSILIGTGRVKPFMIAALIAGVANVVLSVTFVQLGFGLRGIVYGTVIVVIARAGVWLPWYVMRTLGKANGAVA